MRPMRWMALAGTFAAIGCATAAGRSSHRGAPLPIPAGTQIIPTRYSGDRFYATPVLPQGDTVSIFLDTGGGTLVWAPFTRWFGLTVDSMLLANGNKVAVTEFPVFQSGHVPPPVTDTRFGTRLRVSPVPAAGFAAWIARTTQAQLGAGWFGDRIWTFDYPGRRLLLHDTRPGSIASPNHRANLFFTTDSLGKRTDNTPYLDVVIDGDTLVMLIDTGATIWLSPEALAQLSDGKPSERPTCHVSSWIAADWQRRHPDWRVIEHADLWNDMTIIEVPGVAIAGYQLGPVWFSVLQGPATRGNMPPLAARNAFLSRFGGTIGGSVLHHFVMRLDYPGASAEFLRP